MDSQQWDGGDFTIKTQAILNQYKGISDPLSPDSMDMPIPGPRRGLWGLCMAYWCTCLDKWFKPFSGAQGASIRLHCALLHLWGDTGMFKAPRMLCEGLGCCVWCRCPKTGIWRLYEPCRGHYAYILTWLSYGWSSGCYWPRIAPKAWDCCVWCDSLDSD